MKRGLTLRGRALQLLAQREQSTVELRHKLTLHAREAGRAERGGVGHSTAAEAAKADGTPCADDEDENGLAACGQQVDDVLSWLQAQGFASDERFAESRAHARAARFGNLRIRSELSRHGVAPNDETTRALEASELQRAWRVWSIKFGRAPEDATAQARHYRFLAGRGFSAEVIRQVLRQLARHPAEATLPGSD